MNPRPRNLIFWHWWTEKSEFSFSDRTGTMCILFPEYNAYKRKTWNVRYSLDVYLSKLILIFYTYCLLFNFCFAQRQETATRIKINYDSIPFKRDRQKAINIKTLLICQIPSVLWFNQTTTDDFAVLLFI